MNRVPDITEKYAKIFNENFRIEEYKKCDKCNYEYPIIKHEYDFFGEDPGVAFDKCPKCLVTEEDNNFVKRAKETIRDRFLNDYEEISEIPFDLKEVTFEDYKPNNQSQQNAINTVKAFLNNETDKTTLFFQGDTGLGKSHLSYCAYQYYMSELYESAVFIDVPSLMANIRKTYNGGYMTQETILRRINSAKLLVLDDIGAEYVKPDANGFESWATDILFQIANARQGKKNIYTTNFTAKYLTKKYGMMSKRIISRLMSNAKVIKVEGDDHRLKGLE